MLGLAMANSLPWEEFKTMVKEEYCTWDDIQKLEGEFWNLKMEDSEIELYTTRSHELATMCPHMVTPDYKRIKLYIGGLVPQIQSMVTSSNPTNIQQTIRLAHKLTDQAVTQRTLPPRGSVSKSTDNHKRKGELQAKQPFQQPGSTKGCFECGKEVHFRKNCPQLKKGVMETTTPIRTTMETTTFLLNNYFASVLFDTGADRSFISKKLSDMIKGTPNLLEAKYIIKIVDGQIIEATHILKGCKLGLAGHKIDIDLMPVTFGSFDVIVGMDWLSKNQAEIICREKIVRIPLPGGETLSV
ncbi:hypothetical protein L1987_69578 [Smallanthus sonchifolius]|uniref:Uncharacterized protein n=1 Tax=Smallanthus sonchifolius TaxID=185202 RepID=A0ACB9B5H1_9ASTR|nr:hypothetical protein L1987_69578 [Smallanthus sonchifolius]